MIALDNKRFGVFLFVCLHAFKPIDFASESFITEVRPLVLDLLVLLLSYALVSHGEVFVETFLLC